MADEKHKRTKKQKRATLRCPEGCKQRFHSKMDRRDHLEKIHGVELPANLPIAKHVPDERILSVISTAQKFTVTGPNATEIAPRLKITDRAVRQRVKSLIAKGLVARDELGTGYIVTQQGATLLAQVSQRKGERIGH